MLFKQLGMDASCRGSQGITTKPAEENDLGRADMGKRLAHFGVAAVLLAGISLCVAQGYKGFVALKTPPASIVSEAEATPVLPSQPVLLRESMSAGTEYDPVSKPARVVRASLRASQAPGASHAPVAQRAVYPATRGAQPSPRANPSPPSNSCPLTGKASPASGWPVHPSGVPAPRFQGPAYVRPNSRRPAAVRARFGSSFGPRGGSRMGMGFG